MTYKNRFAAVVKVRGCVVAEDSGGVFRIPFGSAYSIYMKNLHSQRALVTVSIDGEDVLDGNSIVIDAHSTHELGGYMRGQAESFDFKFQEKTAEISEQRGDRVDDGLIRIEFAFEEGAILKYDGPIHRPRPKPDNIVHRHHHETITTPGGHTFELHNELVSRTDGYNEGLKYRSMHSTRSESSSSRESNAASFSQYSGEENCSGHTSYSFGPSVSVNDQGISVPGADRHVQYRYTDIGYVGPSDVLVLVLRGKTQSGGNVHKPTVTRSIKYCRSCGKSNSYLAQFCMICGANLAA